MSHPSIACDGESRLQAYRNDLQGLRAVAVASVIIFHFDPDWLPGGFIGVDIFFVISGFLITGNILRDHDAGRFSLTEFYRRRIKRILPVLTCAIVFSLVAGHFILMPEDFVRLAWSALSAQLSAANIYFTFFLDTSYFADDASLEPLLHLWSLGVEEQFYLLWPMAAILVAGVYRKTVIVVIAIVAVISFVLGEFLLPLDPKFAFYMLPTRAGELLAGAICLLIVRQSQHRTKPLVWNLTWLVGAGLVVGSLWLVEESNFPGLQAIPVTLGTAALIYSGDRTRLSATISSALIVWVGTLSYSLYLWHWPVLAYARYMFGPLGTEVQVACAVLIVLLSVCSYHLVEQRFRATPRTFRAVFIRQLVVPTTSVATICAAIIMSGGLGFYGLSPDFRGRMGQAGKLAEGTQGQPYSCQDFRLSPAHLTRPQCIINGTRKQEPSILLWGDSHAAQYIGMLREFAKAEGFSFRNVAHNACPPFPIGVLNVPEWKQERCRQSRELVEGVASRYPVIILSAGWDVHFLSSPNFEDELRSAITRIRARGGQVILLGMAPRISGFDRKCSLKRVKLPFLNCRGRNRSPIEPAQAVNDRLRRIVGEFDDVGFFDPIPFLCDGEFCSAFLKGRPVYVDSGHISAEGSRILGHKVLKSSGVPQAFIGLEALHSVAGSETGSSSSPLTLELGQDGVHE